MNSCYIAGWNGHLAGARCSCRFKGEGLVCLSCIEEREGVDRQGCCAFLHFSLCTGNPSREVPPQAHKMLFGANVNVFQTSKFINSIWYRRRF